MRHQVETHFANRSGWLRAAVLGANDGILSTASLILGVAAAAPGGSGVLVAGIAGLVSGAMSMAAGEYVSVSSQSDSENADIARETLELQTEPMAELKELAAIYQARGVDAALALEVAKQLMSKDALGAHERDELGLSPASIARPIQAAFASAASFSVGAAVPLALFMVLPVALRVHGVWVGALIFLAVLGALGARAGGSTRAGNIGYAMLRVTFWGALAMAVTAGIGALFGVVTA